MNPWHDIAIEPQLIGVVEIPTGSVYKYELEKKNGGLILDRIIPFGVPANYGFIPRTLSEDGDPLDVYILSPYPINPLTQVKVEVIGVIKMTDSGENDEKLICKILGDVQEYDVNGIIRFLRSYKDGVAGVTGAPRDVAIGILNESKRRYTEKMLKDLS